MSDQRPRMVVDPYANLQKQIRCLISRVPLMSSIKDLEKTLWSMEPMVYDMEQSEVSHRHKYTEEFLSLVSEAEKSISRLLEANNISYDSGLELVSVREDLKNLYKRYVKEELQEVARSLDVTGEEAEMALQRLVGYLVPAIRKNGKSERVWRKIIIILDSLKQEPDGRTQLLILLNKVKLLLRFLSGDHGLHISNYLLNCERELREHFVTMDGLAQLKKLDKEDEEDLEKWMWFLKCFSAVAIAYSWPPRSCFNFITIAVAATTAVCFLFYIFKSAPSMQDRVKWTSITLLCLVSCAGVTTLSMPKDGASFAKAQGQISNSYNWTLRKGVILIPNRAATRTLFQFNKLQNTLAGNIPSNELKKYKIFLNFRGGDIRFIVPGVFHSSLEKENISIFFDERDSRKSKRFMEEIKSAISTSLGAITIFSEHYDDSEYCLDELLLILEREKRHKSYIIRPIFYDVEPDDLTDPKSKFGLGLQKLFSTQPIHKVKKWKQALKSVTSIGGDVYKRYILFLSYSFHRALFKVYIREKSWNS